MAPAATAAAATVVHTIGSKVFVHDAEEGWCKAEVVAMQGSSLVVKTERGETRTVEDGEDAPLQNADSRGVEVSLRTERGRVSCHRARAREREERLDAKRVCARASVGGARRHADRSLDHAHPDKTKQPHRT